MVNWLWIGKCHLAMGHEPEAKPWLQKVLDYETTLEEEIEVVAIFNVAVHYIYSGVMCLSAGKERGGDTPRQVVGRCSLLHDLEVYTVTGTRFFKFFAIYYANSLMIY